MIDKKKKCILDLIQKDFICCETGIWKGEFSQRILKKEPKELHLIDPWIYQEYKHRLYSKPQKQLDKIYNDVVKKFQKDNRVKIYRKFSKDIAQLFYDNYFDLIYIDGNHDYEYIKQDILLYLPKVKIGGYMCGDDYNWKNKDSGNELSVKKAVDEILNDFIVKGKSQWVYRKK